MSLTVSIETVLAEVAKRVQGELKAQIKAKLMETIDPLIEQVIEDIASQLDGKVEYFHEHHTNKTQMVIKVLKTPNDVVHLLRQKGV